MGLTFFTCDGCSRSIAATDPRIHCLDCSDYDLCANCAVGEQFTGDHTAAHRTRVFKTSGGGGQGPVLSKTAIMYVGDQAVKGASAVDSEALNSSSLPASTPEAAELSNSTALPPGFRPAEPSAPNPEPLPAPTAVPFSLHLSSLPIFNSPTPPAPNASSPAPNFASQPVSNPSPRPASALSSPRPISAAPVSSFLPHRLGAISPPPPPPAASISEITPPPPPPPVPTKRISMPPPLPARQRPASTVYSLPAMGVSSHTMPPRDEVYTPPPEPSRTMPPRYTPAARSAPQDVPPSATGWGPFFLADLSPTPIFTTLMRTLFTHLDPRRTGALTPEAYSHFLIDQGYVGQDNTWNANLIAGVGQTKEEVADAALRRVFDLFSIEYSLSKRARPPNAPVDALTRTLQAFGTSIGTNVVPPPVSGGLMPLLTLPGFIEITTIEILSDPSAEWGKLSRALKAVRPARAARVGPVAAERVARGGGPAHARARREGVGVRQGARGA
ncbi:hypothetical protein FB451DRAFT_1371420 [Mycena latifolia]|nr:hypothetical protein FB451DRAFT_1371420 [Mycena latifolia]